MGKFKDSPLQDGEADSQKWRQNLIYYKMMVIISNQILIDFLRLNNRGTNIRNEQLGKQLDAIIIPLGGKQRNEIGCGRDNEVGNPFGFPKTSMSYDFPENQLQSLFIKILISIS